jgi:hypothetical protein
MLNALLVTSPFHPSAPLAPGGGAHHAGDPTTEMIAVGLLLVFYWGLFRISSKKATPSQ